VTRLGSALTLAWTALSASCSDSGVDYTGSRFRCDPNHSCPAGQSCVDELCTDPPVVLVSPQAGMSGLALGHGGVYFSLRGTPPIHLDGEVRFCHDLEVGCGSATQLVASALRLPVAVATDTTQVYWTEELSGLVRACPMSGCGTAPITIASAQMRPVAIAIAPNRNDVYWTEVGTGAIKHCSVPCAEPVTVASGQSTPRGLAIDGAAAYWPVPLDPGGSVASCGLQAVCGSTPMVLATAQRAPEHVAVFEGSIYWTNYNEGTIKRCTNLAAGCGNTPDTMATDTPGVLDIAVDASGIYWTHRLAGRIMRCRDLTTGCAANPTVLAAEIVGPLSIVLDDDSIYWTSDAGALYRLAK
jgi:hypothetical protein